MPNRPDYLAIWLGITRVGGVVALLNTNCAGRRSPIASTSSGRGMSSWRRVDRRISRAPRSPARAKIWSHGGGDFARIDEAIGNFSGARSTPRSAAA